MELDYVTAQLYKLQLKNVISITVESGIRDGTLVFVIATSILRNVTMGVPTGAYAIWMFITGSILMWQLGKKPEIDSK